MNTNLEKTLQRIIEGTLFLPKHTMQIGSYLRDSREAHVVAFSGPPLGYLSYRNFVHSEHETKSSKDFLSREILGYDTSALKKKPRNVWLYEPYEWVESFDFLDMNLFCNSYYLFRRYSNKINQKRFFLKFGDELLSSHLKWQVARFDEQVVFDISRLQTNYVVSKLPHAEGGRGLKLVDNTIGSNVLRPQYVARFCEYEVGISQAAVVLADGIACSQPARVWNGNDANIFGSSCTFYDPSIGTYCDLEKVSLLTIAVGRTLLSFGYRGAFGCDYLYDIGTNDLFLSEANLRYTGDVAIFCCGVGNEKTFSNPLHPHSLHILSFQDDRFERFFAASRSGFIEFERQGGGDTRAFFEPGSPIDPNEPAAETFHEMSVSERPHPNYLAQPVSLGKLNHLNLGSAQLSFSPSGSGQKQQ